MRSRVGRPPAKKRQKGKPGAGARDAAIWLTVLRDHRSRGEPSIYVTANHHDFASEGAWKDALQEEMVEFEHPLTLHLSLEALVESLGKASTGPDPTLQDLRRLAEPTLMTALSDRPDLAAAYWDRLEPDWRYRSRVTAARPTGIRRTRRYEPDADADAVILVDADWEMAVVPCFQDVDTGSPEQWSCLQDPEDVIGRLQLFVTERVGASRAAQVVGATFSSPVTLFRQSSGEIMSIR